MTEIWLGYTFRRMSFKYILLKYILGNIFKIISLLQIIGKMFIKYLKNVSRFLKNVLILLQSRKGYSLNLYRNRLSTL